MSSENNILDRSKRLSFSFSLGENGSVLVIGLMFLGIASILGTTAYIKTSTDVMISSNYRFQTQAFYAAEAGAEEVRARMSSIRQSGALTTTWRAFIGNAGSASSVFGYNSGDADHHLYASLQSTLSYTTMIRHKTEADIDIDLNGDSDKNDILLYGDTDGDYNLEVNLTTGEPIDVITCQANLSGSNKRVTLEVVRQSIFFNPPAALYVNGNLTKNGSSGNAIGECCDSSCVCDPPCTPVPDIITTTNASSPNEATNWPAGYGTSQNFVNDYSNIYPVASVVSQIMNSGSAQSVSSGNNQTFGSSLSPGLFFSDGDWSGGGLDGWGILAVNGDFTAHGNISWHGIIIVTGVSTFSGGGNQSIYGSVIANGVTTINGNPDVYYDCNIINTLDDLYSSYNACNWKESY